MVSDDEAGQKSLERKRLLEEIRKRAEEAELKRLEEHEKGTASGGDPQSSSISDNRSAGRVSSPRVEELREKLTIALDRGLVEKAAGLLGEFTNLSPADTDLRSYQLRLAVLQENQQGVKVKKRSSEKMREDAVFNLLRFIRLLVG